MLKKLQLTAKLFASSDVSSLEEDAQWMLKIAEGDVAAFERLYDKYKRPVLGYATALVRNRALAEELTQEVFLRLYRHRASYRPEAKFTSLLWTIARNACFDALRKKSEIPAGEELPEPAIDLETAPEAEAKLMREADQKRLETCLEELTAAQREVLMLRTFSQLGYDAIAETVSTSLSSVKSLLHRAKERLIKCMQTELHGGRHG